MHLHVWAINEFYKVKTLGGKITFFRISHLLLKWAFSILVPHRHNNNTTQNNAKNEGCSVRRKNVSGKFAIQFAPPSVNDMIWFK